jgi:hypothetical protein
MPVSIRSDQWRRRKWTLGSLMIAIAALCGIFTAARPLATPPTIRAAEEVMRKYGPPGLDLDHYEAKIVRKTVSGQWQVDFVRVSGFGTAKHSAFVSDDTIRKFRFNPWHSLPPLAAHARATALDPTTTPLLPPPMNPGLQGMPPSP